jgi:hypothetical protein
MTDPASQAFTLALALRVLEAAPAPRTTVQSPLKWSDDADWKLDYCNVERLTPGEIARRRAEFDEGKKRAERVRADVARHATIRGMKLHDEHRRTLTCPRMNLRTATIIVCIVDTAAWIVVLFATIGSGSDAATKGLDQGAGLVVTALFLVTGAPALALTLLGRGPVTALVLSLAFPVLFAAVLVATVIAFA